MGRDDVVPAYAERSMSRRSACRMLEIRFVNALRECLDLDPLYRDESEPTAKESVRFVVGVWEEPHNREGKGHHTMSFTPARRR